MISIRYHKKLSSFARIGLTNKMMRQTSFSSRNETHPPLPRLTIRVGFAGRQNLLEAEEHTLKDALTCVISFLRNELANVAVDSAAQKESKHEATNFFSLQPPLLRVTTGLCQGADAMVAEVLGFLSKRTANQDCAVEQVLDIPSVEMELAAILPSNTELYRASRPEPYLPMFDEQIRECSWVIEADGIIEYPNPDTSKAKARRAKAYRAQSALLLRQSDLLVAAANPDDVGKAGGTMETVQKALDFELPVLFIHTGKRADNIFMIVPNQEISSVVQERPITPWEESLRKWVRLLTINPNTAKATDDASEGSSLFATDMLNEFFGLKSQAYPKDSGFLLVTAREKIWKWFEAFFQSGEAPKRDPKLAPYFLYRDRATALNYYYSGLYRGAFLLNYSLAVIAVVLALTSLTLLGIASHTPAGSRVEMLLQDAGHPGSATAMLPTPEPWLLPALIVMGLLKLAILLFISRNTRRANRERWNDRAVNFRYLAERLRTMYYLPLVGSFQPPAAIPPQFGSRVVRQSAIDWLFESIVRSVSPAELHIATEYQVATEVPVCIKKRIAIEPVSALLSVRDFWVVEQAKYHDRLSRTMHTMHRFLERVTKSLGYLVILVVLLDLLLIGGESLHLLPHDWEPLAKAVTPWLILCSGVLPAVVAAIGGLLFQSECQRLADRSAFMKSILVGHQPRALVGGTQPSSRSHSSPIVVDLFRRLVGRRPAPAPLVPDGGCWAEVSDLLSHITSSREDPTENLGAWSYDSLRLVEQVAEDFTHEVAEWSVLYAKEIREPG